MANEQISLDLVREMRSIDEGLIATQQTMLAAIKLCISLGGFDADKEVYGLLGIDAGHWSRIHKGEAHFPVNKLCALMDLAGNEAPLMWLVHARQYDLSSLRKRETETERKLRLALERIEELEARERLTIEVLKQVRA